MKHFVSKRSSLTRVPVGSGCDKGSCVWESVTQLRKGKRTSNFFENQLQFTPTKLAHGPPCPRISIWQTFNHLVKWAIFGQTTVASGTLPTVLELCYLQTCRAFKKEVWGEEFPGEPLLSSLYGDACSRPFFLLDPKPCEKVAIMVSDFWRGNLRSERLRDFVSTANKWKS